MPHPKGNVKMTGDTHLPDLQSETPLDDGAPGGVGADGAPQGSAEGLPGARPDTHGGDRRRALKSPIGSIDNPNDGSGPERSGPSER